jgi:hypothetical protein
MRKILLICGFLCLVLGLTSGKPVAQMAGDANGDSVVDVADVVYEINYLFIDGPYPLCLDCADANGDCRIDICDVVYLLNYLFKEGVAPEIPQCDWSEPVNLRPPINTDAGERMFRMSPDGRMAVWSSNRPGGYGNDDIWCSFWDNVFASWSDPRNCGRNVNSGANDLSPSLSPDGKNLYCLLYSRPGGFGDWDIWVSTWDSLHNEWGLVENLGPSINNFSVWAPFLSPDGTKLYCSIYGIAVFEWNGTDWDGPFGLGDNVNTTGSEDYPTVTADNKTLYFTRFDYKYRYYICVSRWTGTEWGTAEVLGPQINDSNSSLHPYITPDGTRLYFMSGREGGLGSGDIWVSERIPARKDKHPKE